MTGTGAFESVFKIGRRREGAYLQLVYAPARGVPGRVGYVLGKKALPLAVDRNRVRRMLREIVRAARPQLAGYDLIVRLKRGCPRTQFRAIAGEAAELLSLLSPAQEAP
ncbi:MAG: ribonuclease P protein component [Betaproteobacteria bacterium]